VAKHKIHLFHRKTACGASIFPPPFGVPDRDPTLGSGSIANFLTTANRIFDENSLVPQSPIKFSRNETADTGLRYRFCSSWFRFILSSYWLRFYALAEQQLLYEVSFATLAHRNFAQTRAMDVPCRKKSSGEVPPFLVTKLRP